MSSVWMQLNYGGNLSGWMYLSWLNLVRFDTGVAAVTPSSGSSAVSIWRSTTTLVVAVTLVSSLLMTAVVSLFLIAAGAATGRWALRRDGRVRGRASGVGRGRGCRQALAVHAVPGPGHGPRDYPAGAAPVVGDGRFSRKRAPDRPPPWARGRRARVCDHPELGVDAPSAPACIRERSRALPVCEYLRQARQTTLGESGVAKPAECNPGPG